MDLLAYWRLDNYLRDLDQGAGFHFNSKQSRLHTAIENGERLWLFTRAVFNGRNEYRLLARLATAHKTINAPSYRYGPYRLWGNIKASRYFSVSADPREDIFELLRLLPFAGTSLSDANRANLAQACQTIRGLTAKGSELLESFAACLGDEIRARKLPDEEHLERALYANEPAQLDLMLDDASLPYAPSYRNSLRESRDRNRLLVHDLHDMYQGRCQVTAHDSPILYGVPTAEAHHIVYRSRGGEDTIENMVLLSPNLHRAIHSAEARFDYESLSFVFANGRTEPLVLNRHLVQRSP